MVKTVDILAETKYITFGNLACITNLVAGCWGFITKCKKSIAHHKIAQKLHIINSKGGWDSDRSKFKKVIAQQENKATKNAKPKLSNKILNVVGPFR